MTTQTQTAAQIRRAEIDRAYLAGEATYRARMAEIAAAIPPIDPNGRPLTDGQMAAQHRLCEEL